MTDAARYPCATIRLRYGKKMLRHGLALGWRAEWDGEPFPVTVTTIEPKTKAAANDPSLRPAR